jgi:hypothetical protein
LLHQAQQNGDTAGYAALLGQAAAYYSSVLGAMDDKIAAALNPECCK